ncbi:hypothetical protein THAOC_23010, partial [Thalassiosira oceanica]
RGNNVQKKTLRVDSHVQRPTQLADETDARLQGRATRTARPESRSRRARIVPPRRGTVRIRQGEGRTTDDNIRRRSPTTAGCPTTTSWSDADAMAAMAANSSPARSQQQPGSVTRAKPRPDDTFEAR